MSDGTIYTVRTNLPPEMVTRVALSMFEKWLDFALGRSALGGKRLIYPTGRYAASLQYRQEGEATVAIVADESIAPEAAILETGHVMTDLKTKLSPGRAYAMHRPSGAAPGGLRRVGGGPPGFRPQIWAAVRRSEGSGYASFGPNSAPDSWIIPAMPAYSPALILSRMAKDAAAALSSG